MTLSVRIEDKTYRRANGASLPVFRDFALDVPAGEICAISGPSGIGKSTLLAIVAGLDRDFKGRVSGEVAPLGMAFQTPRLLPWLTARRNVELVMQGRNTDAGRWLEAVGLAGHEDVYPERLSVGMARRVAIARALAVEPALLLLDEPFASLDPAAAAVNVTLLKSTFAKRAMTVLLVTHDVEQVARLATRVVCLAGSPAQVVSDTMARRALP